MIVYGDPETWGMMVDQFLDSRRLERESFADGTNPKIKMILDMLRRGIDVDTISTITGSTIEEINAVAKKAKPISTEEPLSPEEGISKNKTYSEIDILSNIEAKFPGGNTRDDIIYNPMPNPVPRMDEYMPEFDGIENPKDVARYRQVPLKEGGRPIDTPADVAVEKSLFNPKQYEKQAKKLLTLINNIGLEKIKKGKLNQNEFNILRKAIKSPALQASFKYGKGALKILGPALTPLVAYDTFKAYKEGKPTFEILEEGLLGTGLARGIRGAQTYTPEEREAIAQKKQYAREEEDYSGLSSDFNIPSNLSADQIDSLTVKGPQRVEEKLAAEDAARAAKRVYEGDPGFISETGYAVGGRVGYAEGTPTEDFSDYLNRDTSSNILKDLYLKDIGITGKDDESRLNILQKYLDFNKDIKNNTALNEYVEGAKSGLYSDYVDPYSEGFNLEKDYFKSPNNLRRLAIDYDPRSGKLVYYDKNVGPYGAYKYYSGELVDQDFVDSFGLKRFDPKDEFGFSGFSTQAYGPTNEQKTPTAGLYQTIDPNILGYSGDPTIRPLRPMSPTVEEQMVSPEDALTPPAPDVDPLQQHFEQNQMLKDAVARGEITPEQYNQLGGYDVQQTLSPGNPVLGGIGNLIGSTGYNVVQSLKGEQPFSDIPGDVMRNVQGGFGLISPELKQTYQDIVKRQLPYMDQYQQDYQTRISQVDPNALRNRYLQNLQNTSSQDINQFQSQLRSNLIPKIND